MFDEADFERRVLAVEWSSVETPLFGSIAKAILGLMRSRPHEWPDWQDALEACLLPQSSLGEGVPYAAPFLLELLRDRRGQSAIYWLLYIVLACTEDPRGDETQLRCRELVRSGLSVYLRDLADTSLPLEVRCEIVSVLCSLPEERAAWESSVLAVEEAERTTALGATIREYLSPEANSR